MREATTHAGSKQTDRYGAGGETSSAKLATVLQSTAHRRRILVQPPGIASVSAWTTVVETIDGEILFAGDPILMAKLEMAHATTKPPPFASGKLPTLLPMSFLADTTVAACIH